MRDWITKTERDGIEQYYYGLHRRHNGGYMDSEVRQAVASAAARAIKRRCLAIGPHDATFFEADDLRPWYLALDGSTAMLAAATCGEMNRGRVVVPGTKAHETAVWCPSTHCGVDEVPPFIVFIDDYLCSGETVAKAGRMMHRACGRYVDLAIFISAIHCEESRDTAKLSARNVLVLNELPVREEVQAETLDSDTATS